VADPFEDAGALIQRVYAYVAYRIGGGADAEDVTSQAFERALRYRDSFDPRRGDPSAWLVGIARRCLADRALLVAPQLVELSDDQVEGHETASLRSIALAEAVGSLSERDRELVALRFGADLSARQIAEILDLSPNAVEVALHRLLARLRRELAPTAAHHPDAVTAAAPDATYS
jgi:RNA polymerase sigma-70 factor (ECF subfamily)